MRFFSAVTVVLSIMFSLISCSRLPAAEKRVVVLFNDSVDAFSGGIARDRSNRCDILERLKVNMKCSKDDVLPLLRAEKSVKHFRFITLVNGMCLSADESFISELARNPRVKAVYDDFPVYPPVTLPSTLKGAPDGPCAEGLPQVKAVDVWKRFGLTGKGVRVGHIDTGCVSHPDLKDRIALFRDFVDETNTSPKDTNGHGTHTAGTICGGNKSGVAIGVAPGAKLVVARAIGYGRSIEALLAAMDWMCDPDGDPATDDAPRLVSCSWHSGTGDQTPFYAALDAWVALGIFPCFSAGNSGPSSQTITRPKEHPGVFCSAAVDFNDKVTSFSSRGPAIYKGEEMKKPEAASPGNNVYSASNNGIGYTRKSGTSMACPHTAGVVALLLEARPDLTVADIRRVLQQSADDQGEQGYDYVYGAGRINALKAVEMVAVGGSVDGLVKDAEGKLLAAEVKIVERDITINTDPGTGRFRCFLPAGEYTLVVGSFGYLSRTSTVIVEQDQNLDLTFTLKKAPRVWLTGTVTSAATSEKLAARVEVIGKPLDPVSTDPVTGRYKIKLPAGSYRVRVFSFGHRILLSGELSVGGQGLVADFSLEQLPPLLLVDDDSGGDYEVYYKAALDEMGIQYDVLTVADTPVTEDAVLGYDMVCWFTGKTTKTLDPDEQRIATSYVETGGSLLITGQEIGYDLRKKAFYLDVLDAVYVKDAASSKQVRGQGLDFVIDGDGGAHNQRFPDVIEAANGAETVYSYVGDGGAGLHTVHGEGRIVYLAFGIEGIPSVSGRVDVIRKAREYLIQSDEQLLRRLLLLPSVYREAYMQRVLVPRLGAAKLASLAQSTGMSRFIRALRVIGH